MRLVAKHTCLHRIERFDKKGGWGKFSDEQKGTVIRRKRLLGNRSISARIGIRGVDDYFVRQPCGVLVAEGRPRAERYRHEDDGGLIDRDGYRGCGGVAVDSREKWINGGRVGGSKDNLVAGISPELSQRPADVSRANDSDA